MRVSSAIVAVILSLTLLGPVSADVADPDAFAAGTDLSSAFEGISLSVDGNPTAIVRSLNGTFITGPSSGTNVASTGNRVFGHDITGSSINEQDFFRNWDAGLPNVTPRTVLRVDFDYPTDSVSIDMIADDDDEFTLQAFASDGTLLETVNLGIFAMTSRTFTVERESADIAYILASGVSGEGGALDNLEYRRCAPGGACGAPITLSTSRVVSTSRDHDEPFPSTVRQTTPNPLPFPFSTTLSTSVGNSTNSTQVEFQSGDTFAEFTLTVDHSIDNRNWDLSSTANDLAQTILDVNFVATEDTTFSITGYYELTEIVASGLSMRALTKFDEEDPINRLVNLEPEADDLDVLTRFEVHEHGNIFAGRSYRFSFVPLIMSSPSATNVASAGSAAGQISLLIGTKPPVVVVEPDDFAVGTDLTSAYPPVTLTMEGRGDAIVIARDGFSVFNNRNLATTGNKVFGYEPILPLPVPNGKVWDENTYGLLRADFAGLSVNEVWIDLIFDDDDVGGLWAYDKDGNLLDSFIGSGDGRGTMPFVTAFVQAPGIAYVLAGGVDKEALFLDNLRYTVVPEPSTQVAIDIKPGSDPNCFNINGHGVIPVAILGENTLDVTTIDVDSLLFGGLQVRQRKGRALCSVEDVNDDAHWDLVCKFDDVLEDWVADEDTATLTGQLYDGTSIEGTDSICFAPKKGK